MLAFYCSSSFSIWAEALRCVSRVVITHFHAAIQQMCRTNLIRRPQSDRRHSRFVGQIVLLHPPVPGTYSLPGAFAPFIFTALLRASEAVRRSVTHLVHVPTCKSPMKSHDILCICGRICFRYANANTHLLVLVSSAAFGKMEPHHPYCLPPTLNHIGQVFWHLLSLLSYQPPFLSFPYYEMLNYNLYSAANQRSRLNDKPAIRFRSTGHTMIEPVKPQLLDVTPKWT
jgi:hypothetical protein